MLTFLSSNWFWILLLGGLLFMHLGHGGHGGGQGGHGGGKQPDTADRAEESERGRTHDHSTPRGR